MLQFLLTVFDKFGVAYYRITFDKIGNVDIGRYLVRSLAPLPSKLIGA